MKEDKGLEKLRINYCKGETASHPVLHWENWPK